jgi:hypothetical protein
MDKFYSRLHQDLDWTKMLLPLGEHAEDRHSRSCAETTRKNAGGISTEEESTPAFDGLFHAQVRELNAQGIIRELYNKIICPSCNTVMMTEGAYKCTTCGVIYHIRCLAEQPRRTKRRRTPEELDWATAETSYMTVCFLCNFQAETTTAMPAHPQLQPAAACSDMASTPPGPSPDLEVLDVMGVL